MKEPSKFNVWDYFIPMIFFVCGIIAGLIFPSNTKPSKEYPIEVECHWSTDGYQGHPSMECDSMKGDTLWKDGNKIIAKNIISIKFK